MENTNKLEKQRGLDLKLTKTSVGHGVAWLSMAVKFSSSEATAQPSRGAASRSSGPGRDLSLAKRQKR